MTNIVFAQDSDSKQKGLQFFDNLIGIENTKLYNGKRYYNKFKIAINNHNFFSSASYIAGSLVYDNERFYDIDLKYDLYEDVLVSKLSEKKSFVNLELIKEKVSEFALADHLFVNLDHIAPNSELISGYAELLFNSNNYMFLVKHKKTIRESIKTNKITYSYPYDSKYYLYYNNALHRIKSYKSLRKLFKSHSEAITDFYQSNKQLLKANEDQFMLNLIKNLDLNLTKANTN